jgi:hypothetical protein
MRSGFAVAWGAELDEGRLSAAKEEETRRLAEERFSRPEWNTRR